MKPADLEEALNKELNLCVPFPTLPLHNLTLNLRLAHFHDRYYKQYTAVRSVGGVTWARIGIEEERWRSKGQMQVIFLVHHARSHFLFHSQAKSSQLPYLFAAVKNAFRCNSVESFNLQGKDLASLAKMCLESQGKFSTASLAHAAGGVANPLEVADQGGKAVQRKRGRREVAQGDFHDEEDRAKAKRRVGLVDVFGVDKLPPALQKVEYKMKGGYKGSTVVPGSFHMHVRFEGPNVVLGFRELVETGMADLPLPPHIANLPEQMQSTVEVGED